MGDLDAEAARIREAIAHAGVSIYVPLVDLVDLYYPTHVLQRALDKGLAGLNLNYPIRTRSKVLKQSVCEILGYPTPSTFKKSQPRFPGQNFDTYVQGANNLQVWNEEVEASRRYVIVHVDAASQVDAVRVITGEELAALDNTGTLTSKYQAKIRSAPVGDLLATANDTAHLRAVMEDGPGESKEVIPIGVLFERLRGLVGKTFVNPGANQERGRGAVLHALVREAVGGEHHDSGQFPDFPDQFIEVKLQTSPTIDLGLVDPSSTDPIADLPAVRHCDVRYAIFYATLTDNVVAIERLVLVTGEQFFEVFQAFGGLGINRKRQIPLPNDFFAVV